MNLCESVKSVGQGGRLSLDLRAEFPQSEGFSRTNLYDIKRWFAFYSSQIEFVHQAGGQFSTFHLFATANVGCTIQRRVYTPPVHRVI